MKWKEFLPGVRGQSVYRLRVRSYKISYLQSGTGNKSEHSGRPSLGTQQLCHHTSCVQGCPKPGQHGGTAQAPFMSPSQQMANECAVEMKLSSGLEHERKRHLVFTLFGEL